MRLKASAGTPCTLAAKTVPPLVTAKAAGARPVPLNVSKVVPMVTVAISLPTVVGRKFTVTRQLAFGATTLHVDVAVKSAALAPLNVTAPKLPVLPPVF